MESAYITSKGQLVVPARLRRKYGIKPGTRICFVERDHEIVFQPVTKEYIRSVCGMLKSETSIDRKSTRLNSSHGYISYAVFCLKKKKKKKFQRYQYK